MKNDELLATHADYDAMLSRWRFWMAAYEGTQALVDAGALTRHPREDGQTYRDRCAEAVGFNYSRSIVHLFGNYLFEKPPMRDLGSLAEDSLWQAFESDCDLFGVDLATFIVEQQKYASVYGHVGMLVDTPGRGALSRKEEREDGVYPYLAAYHPEAILDWGYEREEGGRPELAWVKLLEEDGTVLIYERDRWERWRPADDKAGALVAEAELVAGGEHPLGRVPFVWLMNVKARRRNIGVSDIADIALLDASILRDLSLGSEVIKNSAFPMFRTPRPQPDASGEREVEVGPRAVLEWDPEYEGGAKQDWLEAAAREPIEAILMWTSKKAEEIYRMANAGGLHATQVSAEARSGVALRQEFQLLNTVLAAKANNLEEAERAIIGLWLAWQGRADEAARIKVERPKNFSVEDLAADLDNAVRGAELIAESPTFQSEIKLLMAKRLLPKAGSALERIREELAAHRPDSAC